MNTRLPTILISLAWLTVIEASAADRFFTNVLGGNFLTPANWSPNSVPGPADNANFTNNAIYTVTWSASRTNANAFFNATSGIVTQSIGAATWLLTNTFVIGQNAGATAVATHTSGVLSVTNSAASASLVVGQNGRGTLQLFGPTATLVADRLFVTNNSPGDTNSVLSLDSGTLTTLNGSILSNPNEPSSPKSSFSIGNSPGQSADWFILGGTNRILVDPSGLGFQMGSITGASARLILSGPTTLWTNNGNLVVGGHGAGNSLLISNGATMINASTYIGSANSTGIGSSNNVAVISGSNSFLRSFLAVLVGNSNAGSLSNSLRIVEGGEVSCGTGTVRNHGYAEVNGLGSRWNLTNLVQVFNGSLLLVTNGGTITGAQYLDVGISQGQPGCAIIITGTGSSCANGPYALVGRAGSSSNRLEISAGGRLTRSSISIGLDAAANRNELTINGNGSRVDANSVQVGDAGHSNRLALSAGATLDTTNFELGSQASSTNNFVSVENVGSGWTNFLSVLIGELGGGNTLAISNGAAVRSRTIILGNQTSSIGNLLVVYGTADLTNTSSSSLTGTLDVRRGITQLNSTGLIKTDFLTLTNTQGAFEFNGGVLVTRTATIDNGQDFVVGANAGLGAATWVVLSNAAPTILVNGLGLGSNAANATLLLTNGATLSVGLAADGSTSARLGVNVGATNNLAVIAGPNSLWTNSGVLFVGQSGSFNTLLITNGGRVANSIARVGFNSTSGNNRVVVTGAGSQWTHSADLRVGAASAFNELLIADSGQVANTISRIGFTAGAVSNQVTVSGPGSFWINSADLRVGQSGSFNTLLITNGGRVANTLGSIGENFDSSSNQVIVTGSNSVWTNNPDVRIGVNGSFNSLLITNGGAVDAANAYVGVFVSSSNNLLSVDNGALTVDDGTGTGMLDVRRGTNRLNAGLIAADFLMLTNAAGRFEFNGGTLITHGAAISNNSEFTVGGNNGVPALWDVRTGVSPHSLASNLYVGRDSAFNQLMITNGATLTNNGASVIGLNAGSISNLALLAGGGSRWTMASVLNLGNTGSGNRLVVSEGAYLEDSFGNFGAGATPGSNNVAIITDSGSIWKNRSSLRFFGSGNRLVVSNTATLMNDSGQIGVNTGSVRNEVVVTDTGSVWNNTDSLYVGLAGAESRLVINNGGVVVAANSIFLGAGTASTNNRILLDGGTLRATNASTLGLLDIRRGTNVLRQGLIEVDSLLITNTLGEFEFTDGTLLTRNTTNSNGRAFVVGVNNGAAPAILRLVGNGTHWFANGLSIANSGFLTGNGTVIGDVTVQSLGTLSPGTSVGKLVLSNSPVLQGKTVMEISKNGSVLTNDQVQVAGPLTYGGSLTVSNLGPTALVAGNKFHLFSGSSYGGAFSGLTLPKPGTGLNWTNKLLVDGSIAVVAWSGPKIGSVAISGSNLVFSVTEGFPGGAYDVVTSTNIATPLTNWMVVSSGNFDWLGSATITNGINFAEPQRYFSVRTQ